MKKYPQGQNRQSIEFQELGIPHLVRLAKVQFSANTQTSLLPHIHPNQFEICFHYDGRQYYEVEGKGFYTDSGDLFITYPNENHSSGNCCQEKSKLFYFIFELMPDTQRFMGLEPNVSDYIRDTLYTHPRRQIHKAGAMREVLQRIFDLYEEEHIFQKARIMAALVEFFYQLTEYLRQTPSEQTISPDIARVLEALETNTTQNWTVQAMADITGLSLSHFKQKFKKEIGLSPYDCLLRCKISLAQNMLCHTRLSISEIAFELGFSSSQHFADIFKQHTGNTPTQYRRSAIHPEDPNGVGREFHEMPNTHAEDAVK